MTEELRALAWGRVQGVWYRQFVVGSASALALSGWVRNREDGGSVEVVAQGTRMDLEALLGALRSGPPDARVDRVDSWFRAPSGEFKGFRIVR